jgi:hypothetical protein
MSTSKPMNTSQLKTLQPLSYNLRIGITGHRNLPDEEVVRTAVTKLVNDIDHTLSEATKHPRSKKGANHSWLQGWEELLARGLKKLNDLMRLWSPMQKMIPTIPISPRQIPPERQTPVHWTVVSALAKGADQIVAEVVLAHKSKSESASSKEGPSPELKAVLPFSREDYANDFEGNDLANFNRLLDLAPAPTISQSNENELTNDSDDITDRQKGYRAAGYDVVNSSEILIAIWDGKTHDKPGGTGDIVKWTVARGQRVFWIDSTEPLNPVRVLTNQKTKYSTDGPIEGIFSDPLPENAKELSLNFHQLSAFNRDPAYDEEKCKAIIKRETEELQKHANATQLPQETLDPILEHLVPLYAWSTQMANVYQLLYRFAGKGIPLLSAAAVTIATFQVLFFPRLYPLIWFEVLLILLAAILLRVSRNEAWHEKWLNDRHLAERLRTAMHMVLVQKDYGLSQDHPEQLLPFYSAPDVWFLAPMDQFIQTTRKQIGDLSKSPQLLEPLREFLCESWISSQANWHVSNAVKKKRGVNRSHLIGLAMVLLILFMAIQHAIGVGHTDDHTGHFRLARIDLWITLFAITLPAWAAAGHAVDTLLDYERIAERSKQMAPRLESIATVVQQASTFDALNTAAHESQDIMAVENLEWLASLRFQRPEFRG